MKQVKTVQLNHTKLFVLLCVLLFSVSFCFAQNEILWKKNFGGSSYEEYNSVVIASGGIVAVGECGGDSFGSGDWAGISGNGGSSEAFIVKYDINVGITESLQEVSEITVYPNPTTGQLRINNGACPIVEVEVVDVMGRKQKGERNKKNGE